MRTKFKLGQQRETSLFLHYSVLLLLPLCLALRATLMQAIIMAMGLIAIMLTHEIGHALMARRLGYKAYAIELYIIHGRCHFSAPDYELHDIAIAWGGVMMQLVLFAVSYGLFILAKLAGIAANPIINEIAKTFLGLNLFIALFNLLPFPGFDGYTAWRIVPYSYRELRCNIMPFYKKKRRYSYLRGVPGEKASMEGSRKITADIIASLQQKYSNKSNTE